MTEEDEDARKKVAFDALYALDDDDSEGEDPGLLASSNALQGKTLSDPTLAPRRRPKRALGHLSRSLSALTPAPIRSEQPSNPRRTSARHLLDEASVVKDTPVLRTRHTITGIEALDPFTTEMNVPPSSELPPLSSGPPPSSSAIPRVGRGKRKRDADIKTVPEGQQIFRNLHFYFFPNTDTHTGRGMRIIKALEWGASWQKEFNDTVTHIIADKDMKYEHIQKHLKINELPDGIILVNEKYPASCLEFRKLIDPSASEFGVEGYITSRNASAADVPKNITQRSDTSLKLKPTKKAILHAQETPSRSGDSSPEKLATQEAGKETDPDELDIAIREAQETERLALDSSDYEEDISEADPAGTGDGSEEDKTRMTSGWQDRFQCMHKHTGNNNHGPNTHTLSILQELADYYTSTQDEWRSKSYRQAIAALRNHATKVTTKAEAQSIRNIGDSIAEKIEEIVVTNRLRKLDYTKLDERQQILQKFMKVYGVGFNVAEKWVSAGHKTVDDLVRSAELTHNQRIGIEHYEDFNTRIPRAEVEQHSNVVSAALKKLDPAYRAYTMGSYRRGSKSSGDVDIIITKPGARMEEIRSVVLDRLVPSLARSKFLVAALAQTSQADGSKWHGASCLPGSKTWRRIDLLLVPEAELGAALIYFTGNDVFNRSLRLLASKKNMRLNQRGLYKDVLRDGSREKVSEGTLVEARYEKKIFEALGVPWRPPEHRIC